MKFVCNVFFFFFVSGFYLGCQFVCVFKLFELFMFCEILGDFGKVDQFVVFILQGGDYYVGLEM